MCLHPLLLSSCPSGKSQVLCWACSFSLGPRMRKTCEANLNPGNWDPLVVVSHWVLGLFATYYYPSKSWLHKVYLSWSSPILPQASSNSSHWLTPISGSICCSFQSWESLILSSLSVIHYGFLSWRVSEEITHHPYNPNSYQFYNRNIKRMWSYNTRCYIFWLLFDSEKESIEKQ